MVRLIASSDYRYGDKQLKTGDVFEASEHDADIFKRVGKATDVQESDTESDVGTTRKRRSYKRRDMFAEKN
jgi:hypothetical protein